MRNKCVLPCLVLLGVVLSAAGMVPVTDTHTASASAVFKAYLPVVHRAPAQSQLLLQEDFGDGDLSGWSATAGQWSVVNGALRGQSAQGCALLLHTTRARYVDYEVTTRLLSGTATEVLFASTPNGSDHYAAILDADADILLLARWQPYERLRTVNMNVEYGRSYHIRCQVTADRIKVYLDGQLKVDVPNDRGATGHLGVGLTSGVAEFDNLRAVGTPMN